MRVTISGRRRFFIEYLVQWTGYGREHNSWETEAMFNELTPGTERRMQEFTDFFHELSDEVYWYIVRFIAISYIPFIIFFITLYNTNNQFREVEESEEEAAVLEEAEEEAEAEEAEAEEKAVEEAEEKAEEEAKEAEAEEAEVPKGKLSSLAKFTATTKKQSVSKPVTKPAEVLPLQKPASALLPLNKKRKEVSAQPAQPAQQKKLKTI